MISVILVLAKCLFLMYRAISPSFASSTQHDLNGTKVALRESRTNPEIISKQLVNFFNPMTCRPRENQVVQPCLAGANINETLCLKQGCCPVYKGHVKLNCYAPLKDRSVMKHKASSRMIFMPAQAAPVTQMLYRKLFLSMDEDGQLSKTNLFSPLFTPATEISYFGLHEQQSNSPEMNEWTVPLQNTGSGGALRTLRVCCIGAAGLFVFGCLPFCCVFVEKSPCANPLRRAIKDKDLQEDSEESSESQYKDSSQDEEEVPELQKKGRN